MPKPPKRIVFLHLDWGIGGAESLMLQLALASLDRGHSLQLVTTRCDPDHCFAALKREDGPLAPYLHVWGSWIPAHIGGKGQALCSTLRLMYAAGCVVCWQWSKAPSEAADVVVLDVLPTPMWILRCCMPQTRLLFYCHFPDQLLVRADDQKESGGGGSLLGRIYRSLLNFVEESSMHLADTITVNSKFTQSVVRETFPSLRERSLPVLYPALDASSAKSNAIPPKKNRRLLVSLNRFERKKNLELLLHAAALLQHDATIVIAGGYDVKNTENVEYRAELGTLVQQLALRVEFRHSISDAERHELLTTAAAVVYTPAREHFGIVPIEAMAAGTAVVCCDTGGPTETVQEGVTGFLCAATPEAFASALDRLLGDTGLQRRMGQAGRQHVADRFGMERLAEEWEAMIQSTASVPRGVGGRMGWRIMWETGLMLVLCWCLTLLLRWTGVIEEHHSILGGARRLFQGNDEL